jgi:hypothetical protein
MTNWPAQQTSRDEQQTLLISVECNLQNVVEITDSSWYPSGQQADCIMLHQQHNARVHVCVQTLLPCHLATCILEMPASYLARDTYCHPKTSFFVVSHSPSGQIPGYLKLIHVHSLHAQPSTRTCVTWATETVDKYTSCTFLQPRSY